MRTTLTHNATTRTKVLVPWRVAASCYAAQ